MIRFRNITALVVTIIFLIVAFIIFSFKISRISVPKKFFEKSTNSITDTVKVFKNHYGIPHIVANNERDAFFMVGYMQAQDRLWQLDYLRRLGSGKLSEIFGNETINVDKYMKAIDLPRIARKLWENSDAQTKKILVAYTEGINYYIENNKSRLPFEFNAMNFIPKPWHPSDSYIIGRLMALSSCSSMMTDVVLGQIADKIGVKKALELVPGYPQHVPYILDDSIPNIIQKVKVTDSAKMKPTSQSETTQRQNGMVDLNNRTPKGTVMMLNELAGVISEVRKLSGLYGQSNGSNSWVVKKYASSNSGVILANDPHLQISMPANWYQMHLTYPGFNVIGLTFPGIPLFLVGRNNNISWGVTNLMLDDCDIFIEKIDSVSSNFYYAPSGKKEKFQFIKDTIKVKNENDIYYYRKATKRSSVISDVHLLRYRDKDLVQKSDDAFFKKYCLTFSWTGQAITNDFRSLYNLNKAKDWNQFVKATNEWSSPALCFTFADINGNLGVSPVGLIPRRNLANPNIPNPSWLEGYAWTGYLTGNDLPKSFNPSKKFSVAANNKISRNYPNYLSSYWEPASRAERISELLQIHTEYTARDAQIMQGDVLSTYSKQILNLTIPHLDPLVKNMTDIEKKAFYMMKKWDNIMSPLSVGASIFNTYCSMLIKNTFFDELGEQLFNGYVSNPALPRRKILELLQDTTGSQWFDDVRTSQREYKNYILLKSLRDAVVYLQDLLDEQDVNKWTYGKIHKISFRHPLGRNKFLEPSVNSGPYSIGGDGTTIFNTDYKMDGSYESVVYSSMRFVADMDENVIYSVLPGGSSGDPQSENYRDQLQLWLNGGYVQLPVSPLPDNSFELSILLNPK